MTLYESYLQNKFDLSAFGIERGERRSDYFCTPKGAKIIGWTGVDGIHYCTVKSLGETVFAVDPMGVASRHAFPVASSFEDFLRLLLACGHEAYLEQAHAWSREQYDAFALDNPISQAASEYIRFLQSEYSLPPMDDPYAYLKAIYGAFDFHSIPYKKDYFEYVPQEDTPLPKEWQVYFSFHNRNGRERPGEELPLNARFSWAGYEWMVPSAYICAKGLVLDVFAEADDGQVHEFLRKWLHTAEDEAALTEDERRQLESENPLNLDFRSIIEVNGRPLAEQEGMGNVWVPGYEAYQSAAMEDILTHYGLSLDQCQKWKRMSFPWATKNKPSIHSLALKLTQYPKMICGKRFTVEREGQKISFTHPATGTEHTLTILQYADDKLSRMHTISDGYEHPAYYTKMAYTLEPELSGREFSVTDTRQSDAPKKTDKRAPTYDFVSTIAIIGGADGPSAVIAGVPNSPDQPKLHAACSALTFEPQITVEWRMTFRVKTVEDISIIL